MAKKKGTKKPLVFSDNVFIRISESQRERWNLYLKDNPEYPNISHFIRTCVDNFIERSVNINKRIESLEVQVKKILDHLKIGEK